MPAIHLILPLRRLLLLDAATCALMGSALIGGAAVIASLTAIPPALLQNCGLALLPIAAFMAVVATRTKIKRGPVRLIILGNIAWVFGSVLLLATIKPNGLGQAFICFQALVTALLAALEHTLSRRDSVALPA